MGAEVWTRIDDGAGWEWTEGETTTQIQDSDWGSTVEPPADAGEFDPADYIIKYDRHGTKIRYFYLDT